MSDYLKLSAAALAKYGDGRLEDNVNCGHCHTCGTKLHTVLDGEEWCANCQCYRRYLTHGWHTGDNHPCNNPFILHAVDRATAGRPGQSE